MLKVKQAEKIVTRVIVEEKEINPRPEKQTRCALESSSQLKRRDMTMEAKSPSKPKPAEESNYSEQV